MYQIEFNEEELWMVQIALENELAQYDFCYELDQRTEQNMFLLQRLQAKVRVRVQETRVDRAGLGSLSRAA